LRTLHSQDMYLGDLNIENVHLLKDGSVKLHPNIKKYLNKGKYEAPEFNSKYDKSMDIWSFGLLVLQLFTLEDIDVILEHRTKIISKMISSDDDMIHCIEMCNMCLQENPNDRISIEGCLKIIRKHEIIENGDSIIEAIKQLQKIEIQQKDVLKLLVKIKKTF